MNNQNWQLNEGDPFAPAAPDTMEHLPSHHCAPVPDVKLSISGNYWPGRYLTYLAAQESPPIDSRDALNVQTLLRLTSERISTVGSKTLAMQLNGAADHIESLERQLRGLAASVIAASSVNSALERQLAETAKGNAMYEHVRTLNPHEFTDIWVMSVRGGGLFDDLVLADMDKRKGERA